MGMPLDSGRPRLVLSTPGDAKEQRQHLTAEALALHGREFVSGIRQALERSADQHVDLRHGVRRQPLDVRLPSRLAMAELLRPLPDAAEERVEEPARAAPGTEDVVLGILRDHAAGVLDDVAGAGAALERDGAQTRVHGHIDAIERVVGAADLVGEREPVPGSAGAFVRLHVAERQWIATAARQAGIAGNVVDERVEVGSRPRIVDHGGKVPPAPPDVVDLERHAWRDLLRDASGHIPAVLTRVPSLHHPRVDRQLRGNDLREVRIPGPHSPLGAGFRKLHSGTKLACSLVESVQPLASELWKTPQPGRAVIRPLVNGVERRHVAAHEELQGRLPVANHVVGHAESAASGLSD